MCLYYNKTFEKTPTIAFGEDDKIWTVWELSWREGILFIYKPCLKHN
jgi:hypothetical protein